MRTGSVMLAGLAAALVEWVGAGATTLLKLSLDDMIHQSTGIVRARVTGSRSALHGSNIYTFYRLRVLESAKTTTATATRPGQDIEVAVPGGTLNGVRSVAIGSPELINGSEYVVFLWTGKSGLTQIIGLSQGLFLAAKDPSGAIRLSRPAGDEPMLDQNGRTVADESVALNWTDVRARIRRELGN